MITSKASSIVAKKRAGIGNAFSCTNVANNVERLVARPTNTIIAMFVGKSVMAILK